MKILVCISHVPDTTTKITFSDDNKNFNSAGVQYIINPYDELALTRALEINEATGGGTVTVVNVGLAATEPTIRKCLAIGATDAIRIDADPTDAYFVAQQIANFAQDKNFDIVFTGRESIDYNGGQVSGMLAELLDLPSVNVISKIDVEGNKATIERDIDGGREVVEVETPFVASAQKQLTEPRIPNMRGIMMARKKPLTVVEAIDSEKQTQVTQYAPPAEKGDCTFVDANNMSELVKKIHEETKVI